MKAIAYMASAALALGVVGCKNESTSSNTPGNTPGDRAAEATRTGVNATTQGAANAGGAIAGAANNAGDAMANAGRDAKDAAARGADRAGDAAARASENAKDAGRDLKNAAKDGKDAVVAAATPSGASDVSGIRGALEGVVQNALDNNNFKTMTNHLVDADQKRLESANLDLKPLNDQIDQFKKQWRDKYGADAFGVMDAEKVFSPDFVALTADNASSGDAKTRTGKATIKASHGLPELTVPVVGQDGKWRLDIPDEVDANQLQQNLQKAVQELNGAAAQWPADKTQAYQHVAHRILMAVTSAK